MTRTPGDAEGPQGRPTGAKGPDELRAQIAETRGRLGDTVEELAAKADVKARARAQVAELKGTATHAAHSVQERVPQVPHVPRAVVLGGVGVGVAVAAGWMVKRRHGH
jgi:hypothetical protein